jgi:hypothetical protein
MKFQYVKKSFFLLVLSYLVISSFYYGYKYSFFNTDIHHYSVILEAYLDKINGYKLNKDIFIQYGNGQIYLFEFFSKFVDINLVNIGIITQIFFSIKFILFYFILRFFVNDYFSILGTIIYYLLYTFTQTASGDIYANFFLHLFVIFYLYNSNKENFLYLITTSFLLFLVFLFRHTYILNFVIFIPIILILYLFLKKNLMYELKLILIFTTITFLFFIYLYNDGTLFNWFDQFLGIGTTAYLDLNTSSGLGIFIIIKKLIFYVARIARHILIPDSNGSSYFFSIIIFSNIYFLFMYILKFYKTKIFVIERKEKLLLVLSLLAFCGTIQLINKFEIARYINASFTFIIIFIYVIYKEYKKVYDIKKKILFLSLLGILLLPVIYKYPFYSNFYNLKLDHMSKKTEYKFNNKYFLISDHIFFGKKRFNDDFVFFYNDIKNFICKYDKIYNISYDRSLHYLCDVKKEYISSLFFKKMNKQFSIDKIYNDSSQNSILISDQTINEFLLVKTFKVPKYYRYTKSDIFFTFFSKDIYIYEIN